MATPWRDHPAWHVIDDAEAALGEKVGFLVTDATADDLARTREAQLAVLLTSLVVWEAMQPLPEVPVAFAGHSLGQVTALIAAGVLPLEVGVRFAARRAELTQAAADRHPGRMAALLGATHRAGRRGLRRGTRRVLDRQRQRPGPDRDRGHARRRRRRVGPRQGGRREARDPAQGRWRVPHPADARRDRRASPRSSPSWSSPHRRRRSSRTTTPSAYSDADGWRTRLADHVSVPVRWRPTMDTLVGLGADTFLEVGHGSMLAALAKRGVPDVTVRNIAVPEDSGAIDRGGRVTHGRNAHPW